MLTTPEIIEMGRVEAAVIHLLIPRAEIARQFGPTVRELIRALRSQGVQPAGPVFAHHLTTSTRTFDFELGFEVRRPIAPAGRVKPSCLPAANLARTVYQGAYEGLFAAWGEFGAWIENNALVRAPGLWEVYLQGPETSPDPALWRTQLNQPLVSR